MLPQGCFKNKNFDNETFIFKHQAYFNIGRNLKQCAFNNFDSQSSIEVIEIYDNKLNSRDAWSKLILNYANKDLDLLHDCTNDESKRFELNAGLSLNKKTKNLGT